jgi:hypothetical protein
MYNRYCSLMLGKRIIATAAPAVTTTTTTTTTINTTTKDKLQFIITEERKFRRFKPGIHPFSKNLGAASKFQAPEG